MSTYKKKKRIQPKIDPESSALFEELCEVFKKLGMEIRMEEGYFSGGICLLEDHEILFINKNHAIEQNIDMLLEQLKTVNLDHFFLSPKMLFGISACKARYQMICTDGLQFWIFMKTLF